MPYLYTRDELALLRKTQEALNMLTAHILAEAPCRIGKTLLELHRWRAHVPQDDRNILAGDAVGAAPGLLSGNGDNGFRVNQYSEEPG